MMHVMNGLIRQAGLAFLGLTSLVCLSLAQANDVTQVDPPGGGLEHHAQQWSVMILQGQILGQVRGYLEIQPRTDLSRGELDRILIRPALYYPLGREVTLWAGYAAVATVNPSLSWEHRAWQQIQHERNFGGVVVINRTRFEERFLPGADDIGLRIRHMLRAVIPVDDRRIWAVVFSDEVFFNLNSPNASNVTGFDQNRAFAGVSWNIAPQFRIEAGYMNVFVNRPGDTTDRMNHVGLMLLNYSF